MARVDWEFEAFEINAVRSIIDEYRENPFVQRRIERNVDSPAPDLTRSRIWQAHLMAQLTSQQRSGPESSVFQFLHEESDAVALDRCRSVDNVEEYVSRVLREFGGIRFYGKVGEACQRNLRLLERNQCMGWEELERRFSALRELRSREPQPEDAALERDVCKFVSEDFGDDGFYRIGPKQSRNFLQALGLTRFEIPLDSRITKWVNDELRLPYPLSAGGLGYPEFYDFQMDLIQDACRAAEQLPCVFDAAVFTSYTPDWPEETAEESFF